MIACMGGWCGNRGRCAHYYSDSEHIVERLCGEMEEVEPMGNAERVMGVRQVCSNGGAEVLPFSPRRNAAVFQIVR